MAEVQDWRVSAVEPGVVDTEHFGVGVLGDTGRDGRGKERGGKMVWVRGCHDAVCDFEIRNIRSQGTNDPA